MFTSRLPGGSARPPTYQLSHCDRNRYTGKNPVISTNRHLLANSLPPSMSFHGASVLRKISRQQTSPVKLGVFNARSVSTSGKSQIIASWVKDLHLSAVGLGETWHDGPDTPSLVARVTARQLVRRISAATSTQSERDQDLPNTRAARHLTTAVSVCYIEIDFTHGSSTLHSTRRLNTSRCFYTARRSGHYYSSSFMDPVLSQRRPRSSTSSLTCSTTSPPPTRRSSSSTSTYTNRRQHFELLVVAWQQTTSSWSFSHRRN